MIHRYIIEATDEVKGFEEAIERLDREWGIEELEPCNDAISRQAVQDLTSELLSDYLYDEDRKKIEDMDAKIGELPSVMPQYTDAEIQKIQELEQAEIQKAYELGKASQSKTGYWIDDCGGVKCSCCGYCIDDYYYVKTYCPNCGAKME